MQLEIQATPFGPYTAVDLAAAKLSRLKLKWSYQHPATASWTLAAPQQSLPWPLRSFVRLWDDAGQTPDGAAQSAANPLFEGFIEEAQPGAGGDEVHYVAYDPTRKTTAEYCVMSAPWPAGAIGGAPPVPGFGAYPRLVFNSKIDNDDDYAFERAHDLTLGEIAATLLGDLYHPLYWSNAAPGDGTSAGNGAAYLASDLAAWTFRPQEKLVFESESLRSALERLLQWEPASRLFWAPGTRQWRFFDLTAAPEVTLTLNDPAAALVVLSLELHRSLAGRYTAVKVFGPQALVRAEAVWSAGSLTKIPSGTLLQNNIATCCSVEGLNQFQITDPNLRRVARLLPLPEYVQFGDYAYATTRSPTLLAYWPATSAGQAGWRAVSGWQLDAQQGIISFGANYLYRYNPNPAGGQPHHENPTDVKFIYAYPASPISVRYPTSGFAGSAFEVAGLANEFRIYDEMLAVGYEYGQPVTTLSRQAQFLTLAERVHAQRKEIIYAGGVTLDGIAYAFCRLNRRINLAGADANGAPLPTGWEQIRAFLTDVEFDYEQQLTTLQFSSDQLELLGMDPEQIKTRLRIRALELRTLVTASAVTRLRNRRFGDAFAFSATGDTLETSFAVQTSKQWVDPETGEVST